MSLKFTFGGAASERHDHDDHDDHDGHDHGGSGIPLPFLGASSASSASGVLELRASIGGDEVVCEALSGDGVSYARASRLLTDDSTAGLAASVRSALARTGAELPEPLLGSVTGIVLDLGGAESAVLAEWGVEAIEGADPLAAVDSTLQARIGITAGTPIRSA